MSRRVRTGALAAVASVVAAFGAAPALADTTAKVDGNVLTIEAGALQENHITVAKDSNSNIVRVTEAADAPRVNARKGCAQPNNRQASCALGAGGTVRVQLHGGFSDFYSAPTLPFPQTVDGGDGIDHIFTGSANDTLNGGSDGDDLNGGPGIDRLNGESDDDHLDGGPGGDTLSGGAGRDSVDYVSARQFVVIDLTAGFARVLLQSVDDNVFGDVEDAAAGVGRDLLIGDQGDNRLYGEQKLSGAEPPSESPDGLRGLGGNDDIRAGDNRARDEVSCGAGSDFVELDLTDVATADPSLDDCETIQRRAVDQGPTVTIRARRAKVAGGDVLVPLSCSRRIRRGCRGRLSAKRRSGARLGGARYRIRRGGRLIVGVPLSRTGRRLVARPGRLRVEVTARERDPKGRPKVSIARFKLRGS
jgi:Ca2+-binding RTX toxin-like protein